MISGYFGKTVVEVFTFAMLYEGRLPPGAAVTSGLVDCRNASTGALDNSLIGSTIATVDGNKSKVVVLAGSAGVDYFLTFTTTLTDGSILEDVVVLRVSA